MKKRVNIKQQLRSKTFLVSMFSALLMIVQVTGDIFGYDMTIVSENATKLFNAVLMVLCTAGIVVNTAIVNTESEEEE